jgi:effector-binding domain-containing protein
MTDLPTLKGTLTLPRLATLPSQAVLVLRADMAMTDIDSKGPALLDRVLTHLQLEGIAETGPAFFRYDVIDMVGTMSMSFGAQVPPGTAGAGDIVADILPAGRYVSVLHNGHPDELYDATIMLIEWAKVRGVQWDVEETAEGDRFAARMEFYHDGPEVPKDQWTTEIRIRLRD